MKIIQKPVGLMEVFCYLVMDEETAEAILIDPAGNEDELAALVQANKAVCRYIVNTHGHADHTCGNARMKELLGAPIVLHALDDDFFQRPENQQFARAMGFPVSPPADIRVQDGDALTFGKLTLRFLHTPGHTPGACCLLIDGNLFTGDTLFVGAVGRTDLPGASFDELLQSLRKIIQLPPETVIWPGHDYGDRPTSTVADEMRTNPYITDFLLDEE